MSTPSIRLPAALQRIPPLPQIMARALELIRDPQTERAELAQVLALDQGMTGLFLKMVNSAYYGLPRRVTSLDEAIGYLGFERIKQVVVAVSVRQVLSRPVPAYALERTMLWKHSVGVAAGADWIAGAREIHPRSDAYVAGLLHDVGKLVLDLILGHEARWEGAEDEPNPRAWVDVERQLVGHDHAEVGAVVVRAWNLPDNVIEAIACHHEPARAEAHPQLAAAVHVANAATLMAGIGLGLDGLRHTFEPKALALLEWQQLDLELLMAEVQNAVLEAEELLGLHP